MSRIRSRLGWKGVSLIFTGLILAVVASAYALDIPAGFEGFQFTPPYNTRNPFDAAELAKIDHGFQVFDTETFVGNGRTCTTCHIPSKNFNITSADMAALSAADQLKVLGGTNATLENGEILGSLALFNINQGSGAGTEGDTDTPLGPFRASMSIGGLGFSTLNRFVCRGGPAVEPSPLAGAGSCSLALAGTKNGSNVTFTVPATTGVPDPREFSLYAGPPPGTAAGTLLTQGLDYTISGRTVTMTVAPAASSRLVAVFPGSGPIIDDGTRDIMLGWAGDGALKEMFGFTAQGGQDPSDCQDAIDDFFSGNLTNLEKALGTFSLAAVKTHFTRTQNRTPGVDFRCPTADELRDMAKFQKWLGRRFELDITKLVILERNTETGRRLFSNRAATCVACHVNAGASDSQGRLKADPIPFVKFADGTPAPELNGGTTVPLEIIGANKASRNGVRFLEAALQSDLGAAPIFPNDKGDESLRGGSGGQGGFSVQSIVEATRKTQFFHNNGVEGTIEDGIMHYFTGGGTGTPGDPFTGAFDLSQGGGAVRNAFRSGLSASATLAGLTALSPNPVNKMGLFLRALSAVYLLADCERLVDEMQFRIDSGMPLDLPVNNCKFALADAKDVLQGIKVSPNPFKNVPKQLGLIESKLDQALATTNVNAKKGKLNGVRGSLQGTRQSLMTTPELP